MKKISFIQNGKELKILDKKEVVYNFNRDDLKVISVEKKKEIYEIEIKYTKLNNENFILMLGFCESCGKLYDLENDGEEGYCADCYPYCVTE